MVKMPNSRIAKPIGRIGSWFALMSDDELRHPILWQDQIKHDGSDMVLETDWQENARPTTGAKRQAIRDYYKADSYVHRVIIGIPKDTTVRPRELDGYACAYDVEVVETVPEIRLRLMNRIEFRRN